MECWKWNKRHWVELMKNWKMINDLFSCYNFLFKNCIEILKLQLFTDEWLAKIGFCHANKIKNMHLNWGTLLRIRVTCCLNKFCVFYNEQVYIWSWFLWLLYWCCIMRQNLWCKILVLHNFLQIITTWMSGQLLFCEFP